MLSSSLHVGSWGWRRNRCAAVGLPADAMSCVDHVAEKREGTGAVCVVEGEDVVHIPRSQGVDPVVVPPLNPVGVELPQIRGAVRLGDVPQLGEDALYPCHSAGLHDE